MIYAQQNYLPGLWRMWAGGGEENRRDAIEEATLAMNGLRTESEKVQIRQRVCPSNNNIFS